jgi:hypothetical protein
VRDGRVGEDGALGGRGGAGGEADERGAVGGPQLLQVRLMVLLGRDEVRYGERRLLGVVLLVMLSLLVVVVQRREQHHIKLGAAGPRPRRGQQREVGAVDQHCSGLDQGERRRELRRRPPPVERARGRAGVGGRQQGEEVLWRVEADQGDAGAGGDEQARGEGGAERGGGAVQRARGSGGAAAVPQGRVAPPFHVGVQCRCYVRHLAGRAVVGSGSHWRGEMSSTIHCSRSRRQEFI